VPRDGLASLAYDAATNRISTIGWEYDAAGNQTRVQLSSGAWQRYQYDAAGRLLKVLADDNQTVLATYTYGADNARLLTDEGGLRTYYAWSGDAVVAEYTESGAQTSPQWTKSYIYLGGRLLSTITPSGSGEYVQYHHPDRLGTRLITNSTDTTSFEQVTLPYGTALETESSGATNRRFTSYDRSSTTGLDYAVNRHYDSQQGRFTQVDPIGMQASSLSDPQTLNLYAYCGNDPINRIDPNGLFWGKVGRFFKKLFSVLTNKWVQVALLVALTVFTYGATSGWWAFTTKITKVINIGMDLGYGTHVATTTITVLTAVGKIAVGVGAALAIGGVNAAGVLSRKAGIIMNVLGVATESAAQLEAIPWGALLGAVANFLQASQRPDRQRIRDLERQASDCLNRNNAILGKDLQPYLGLSAYYKGMVPDLSMKELGPGIVGAVIEGLRTRSFLGALGGFGLGFAAKGIWQRINNDVEIASGVIKALEKNRQAIAKECVPIQDEINGLRYRR
jgi:RHS repeat-associated protein